MSNAEILSAAVHEAGHFVFACSQQQTPDFLEMSLNQSNARWEGMTELPSIDHLAVADQFEIGFGFSLAGCFAQVKHAVRLLDPSEPMSWGRLSSWVIDDARRPLALLLTSGQCLTVPSGWFDDQDAASFNRMSSVAKFCLPDFEAYGDYLHQAFESTVEVMENPKTWRRIERSALMLASSISGLRARLDVDQVPRS